ncbi:MAG: sigma factor [Chloroflexota bacterium]
MFDRHYDAVRRHLARRVGRDLAADLAAETFTTALTARGRYDTAHRDARPWLFGIATNLLRNRAAISWDAVPQRAGSAASDRGEVWHHPEMRRAVALLPRHLRLIDSVLWVQALHGEHTRARFRLRSLSSQPEFAPTATGTTRGRSQPVGLAERC